MAVFLQSRTTTVSIGGLDFSGCLKSLVLNDAAWEKGLCPTSGTLTLSASQNAPESLDDLENPRFFRGQSVVVEVEGNRHPRGALRIISAVYNGGELSLEVGCLLALLSYRQPTDPDATGASLGSATTLLTVASSLLNAAGISAIATVGANDQTIHYLPNVSGSYISTASDILYSLGNVGFIDNQEVLQIRAVDPQPSAADTVMLVGEDCKDPVRNRGLELPPEKVVATGQSVVVKVRANPYQLGKTVDYADASTLHEDLSGSTVMRIKAVSESVADTTTTRTTVEDLVKGIIGQGLDLGSSDLTLLRTQAQYQQEFSTYEPGNEGRLLKYERRVYKVYGLAIPTFFSWHKQNGTEPYWKTSNGGAGSFQSDLLAGPILAERETSFYTYTDGYPSKKTTTLELCEGGVLGDIDIDWEEWYGTYGFPVTLAVDTITTEEWTELQPGTWQKITSIQRATGRQQPQRFENLDSDKYPTTTAEQTYIKSYGVKPGSIATTTDKSNSGQLKPPAIERRQATHFQETSQCSASYSFPQLGGTYQERQATISVPYLPSSTQTDKPGVRHVGSGSAAQAALTRAAYLEGATKIARAKGSRIDARLTHDLMQGYRPLMTVDVVWPGGTRRRFGLDACTWVLTQTECLISFNGLYWGSVSETGSLTPPYAINRTLASGYRYGGGLEMLPYSLGASAIALRSGYRYGGNLSLLIGQRWDLVSGYRYGGNLSQAVVESLRGGYRYGGSFSLSAVSAVLRSGYRYGGNLNQQASWTPQNITTAIWLDADDAATFTLNSGVHQWNDKSGNNRHFSQGTAANRPARTTAALNGRSVVTFDGSNDQLDLNTSIAFTSQSTFVVFRYAGTTTYQRVFTQSDASFDYATGGYYVPVLRNAGTNAVCSYAEQGERSSLPVPTATYTMFGSIHSGSAIINYANGTAGTSFSQTLNKTFTRFRLGGPFGDVGDPSFLNGAIAEIVVLPNAASTDIRQRIEGYLAHRWGLTASLPSGHPYKANPPVV